MGERQWESIQEHFVEHVLDHLGDEDRDVRQLLLWDLQRSRAARQLELSQLHTSADVLILRASATSKTAKNGGNYQPGGSASHLPPLPCRGRPPVCGGFRPKRTRRSRRRDSRRWRLNTDTFPRARSAQARLPPFFSEKRTAGALVAAKESSRVWLGYVSASCGTRSAKQKDPSHEVRRNCATPSVDGERCSRIRRCLQRSIFCRLETEADFCRKLHSYMKAIYEYLLPFSNQSWPRRKMNPMKNLELILEDKIGRKIPRRNASCIFN